MRIIRIASFAAAIGSLITLSIVIYMPISKNMIELFLLMFGIFSAAFLPAFSIARDICEGPYVATGLSFMNMMNMIGIALAQPLVGYFLD